MTKINPTKTATLDRVTDVALVGSGAYPQPEDQKGESSVEIRKRVMAAREIQTRRFEELDNVHYNAQMNTKQIREFCKLDDASKELLKNAMERLNLSARAYDRILKVARTIADLENKSDVNGDHIGEAIQYRSLDREGWLG